MHVCMLDKLGLGRQAVHMRICLIYTYVCIICDAGLISRNYFQALICPPLHTVHIIYTWNAHDDLKSMIDHTHGYHETLNLVTFIGK
jgi:hypothetical protein